MRGPSNAVGLLVKGLMLGMSFGAAMYGERGNNGRVEAAGRLLKEAVMAAAPQPHGRGRRGRRG